MKNKFLLCAFTVAGLISLETTARSDVTFSCPVLQVNDFKVSDLTPLKTNYYHRLSYGGVRVEIYVPDSHGTWKGLMEFRKHQSDIKNAPTSLLSISSPVGKLIAKGVPLCSYNFTFETYKESWTDAVSASLYVGPYQETGVYKKCTVNGSTFTCPEPKSKNK